MSRGPRKFRILICFNLKNRSSVARNLVFCFRNSCNKFLDESRHLDRDKKTIN